MNKSLKNIILIIIFIFLLTLILYGVIIKPDNVIRYSYDKTTIRIFSKEDCLVKLNTTVKIGEITETIKKEVQLEKKETISIKFKDIIEEEFGEFYKEEPIIVSLDVKEKLTIGKIILIFVNGVSFILLAKILIRPKSLCSKAYFVLILIINITTLPGIHKVIPFIFAVLICGKIKELGKNFENNI